MKYQFCHQKEIKKNSYSCMHKKHSTFLNMVAVYIAGAIKDKIRNMGFHGWLTSLIDILNENQQTVSLRTLLIWSIREWCSFVIIWNWSPWIPWIEYNFELRTMHWNFNNISIGTVIVVNVNLVHDAMFWRAKRWNW